MNRAEAGRINGKKGGRKPGPQKPILKEAEREKLRLQILAEREEMTKAQIAHAKGISYMVLRNPDGTYTRASNEEQLNAALAAGSEAFRIFTQAPNVQAYTDLMNRALDKPAEQLKVTGADDGPVELVFKWMTNATPKLPTSDGAPKIANGTSTTTALITRSTPFTKPS